MIRKLLSTYSHFYHGCHLDRWFGKFSKFPKVLFYHGVEKEILDPKTQCVQMDFELFRRQMLYLKQMHFEIISLNELERRMHHGEFNGKEVILTFDDGYKNNLEIVYPILKELEFPFSVFVSTRHIDENLWYPPFTIRALVYHSGKIQVSLDTLHKKIPLRTDTDKKHAEKYLIEYIKKASLKKVNKVLQEVLQIHLLAVIDDLADKFSSESLLSWDDLDVLHGNKVEIGSHCHDHIILHDMQDLEEIFRQLKKSKQILEERYGTCRYLAYPNGRKKDVSEKAKQLAGQVGYSMALSTWMRSVSHRHDRMFIPRYIAPYSFTEFVYLINNVLFDKLT